LCPGMSGGREASMTRTQPFSDSGVYCRSVLSSDVGIFDFWLGRGDGIVQDVHAISDDTARIEKSPSGPISEKGEDNVDDAYRSPD
jgi:hypothetical protein